MSFFDALEIAASGMTAQRTRMDVASMNMANEGSTRTAEGGPYRRRDVVLRAENVDAGPFARRLELELETDKADALGVKVDAVSQSNDPFNLVYDPSHPDANPEGYVAYPNVDAMHEMMNMMGAARAYEAQTTVVRTVKQMAEQALRIGKA